MDNQVFKTSLIAQKNLHEIKGDVQFTHGGTDWVIVKTALKFQTLSSNVNGEEGWLGGVVAQRLVQEGDSRSSHVVLEDKKFFLLFTNVLKFPGYTAKVAKSMTQHLIAPVTTDNPDDELTELLCQETEILFDKSVLSTMSDGKGV